MFKKLLLATAIVLGLIYGSGSDLTSVKRSITGAANESARSFTAGDNNGWGSNSGY
ncbi:MAG: hypothetical protein R3E14_08835 [Erythrobacter sp.]